MNDRNIVRKICINGGLAALVFITTYATKIPIPLSQGYFNLGDTIILIAASAGKQKRAASRRFWFHAGRLAGRLFLFRSTDFCGKGD